MIRRVLVVVLLLSLACATQWVFKARYADAETVADEADITRLALTAVPTQVRNLIGDYFWMTADEYMHFGGSRRMGEGFLAGTYGGNTEIIPLLELAVLFNPGFIDAHIILAENKALYLDRFREGIATLQRGITANRASPRVHELYGSVAFTYAFIDKYTRAIPRNPAAVLKYLDRAVAAYERAGRPPIERPPLAPQTYHVLRSRMFVDLHRPQEALAAWRQSGLDLAGSPDLLARYLRLVAAGAAVPANPEDLLPPPAPATAHAAGNAGGPAATSTTNANLTPAGTAATPTMTAHHPDDAPIASPARPAASAPRAHPSHAPGETCRDCAGHEHHDDGEIAVPGEPPILLATARNPLVQRIMMRVVLLGLVGMALWWRRR